MGQSQSHPSGETPPANECPVSLVIYSAHDAALARTRAEQLTNEYAKLELELVLVTSINDGFSQANGRKIAFLDAEVEPQPGWLPALLKCAKGPACIVGSLMCASDGTVERAGISIDADNGVTGRLRGVAKTHFKAIQEASVPAVDLGAALITRRVIEDAAPLEMGLGDYAMVDFCLRAAARGASVRYCPTAIVDDRRSWIPLESTRPGLRGLLEQTVSRDRFFHAWLDQAERPPSQSLDKMRRHYARLQEPTLEYLKELGARDPSALMQLANEGSRP